MEDNALKRIEKIGGHIVPSTTTSEITSNKASSSLNLKANENIWEKQDRDTIILEKVVNRTTTISLNRPKQLNVLNTDIFVGLNRKLLSYARNDNLDLLILKGSGGKAYCAGGDIKELTSQTRKLGFQMAKYFFTHEYNMDYTAATLKKPRLVIWDGIAMGGGLGVSVHSNFRIVTEKTVWAMPEVSIGLFPDVGGSYFLARLPDSLGNYLAITGKSITGADCIKFGIATHFVLSKDLPALEEKLQTMVCNRDINRIETIVNEFTSKPGPSQLEKDWGMIQKCFANKHNNVHEILQSLKESNTKWGADLITLIRKKSPTSVKIAFRQVKEGVGKSLEQVFVMEYRIALRCLLATDFFEGVRAVVVDKDHNPKWNPATLELVTDEMVEHYFSPLPTGEEIQLGSSFYLSGLHQ